MPGRNRPLLDDIRTMPLGEVAGLPAEHLALLQEEASASLQSAKNLKDWLDAAIALRYGKRAAALRQAEGKDTGTVRFDDSGVTVVADVPKKVEWEQARLAELVTRIRGDGEDPADYVEVSYRVPERKYAGWPKPIRAAFAAARTVKIGKPSFLLRLAPDA